MIGASEGEMESLILDTFHVDGNGLDAAPGMLTVPAMRRPL